MDDFTDDITTSGRLSVGTPTRGVIEAPGDVDWFAVDLVAGQTYHFMLLGYGWYGGTLFRARPSLYDENNQRVETTFVTLQSDDRMYGGFGYTPEQSGTFFAEIEGSTRAFPGITGSYTLELSQMVPETGEIVVVPNGTYTLEQTLVELSEETRALAYPLQIGQPVGTDDLASFGPDLPDIDWF